jgi:hypothetical protein
VSRAAPAPRGGRNLTLPMANAGVVPRALVALVVLNALKLAVRYLIVATAPIGALIPLFAAYNAIAAAPFALWAMNGPPRPTTDRGAVRRAVLTTLAMQLGLALPETALQVRELMARTPDTVQLILQVIIQAMPYVTNGLLELAVVTGFGYAILKLRMPPAPRRPAASGRRP